MIRAASRTKSSRKTQKMPPLPSGTGQQGLSLGQENTPTSPEQIMHLQRTIGNRAVTHMLRKPMIQRAFEDGGTFVTGLHLSVPDPAITRMGELMTEYNLYLTIGEKTPEDYGRAAGILKTLDRTIFQWLDAKNATHTRLEDIPNYPQIRDLRAQAAREHEDFVAAASAADGAIPFDLTGMERTEAAKLITLWTKIKNGTGKIQLVGNPAHKKQIYSWIVKLLETPTGRKLMGYLDAGDPAEVMTNVYIGQTKEELPDGVADKAAKKGKTLENTERSEAQPLGTAQDIEGPMELTGDEDADDYPTVADPEGLRNALVEGAEGAILHGKKYKFRKEASVGAFVTAREGESKNESAAHHQILTPGWVTMGHELGHAAHMRGGATTMATPTIMQDITGRGEEELNATWQNSEELVTIRGWENALRTDVGLTTRASHIPYDAGKKIERYYSIYSDMKATYPHPFYLEIPDMKTFKTDLQRANNSKDASVNLENDVVYADLQRRWAALRTRFNVADLRPIFMRFLQPVRDRVVRKYTAKKLVYDGKYKIFMKKTKKQAWQTVVTNYTAVMDDYDNHLDAKLATLPGYQTFKDKLDTLEDAVEETTF